MRLKIYQSTKLKRLSRSQLALLVAVLMPFMPGYLSAKPFALRPSEQGFKNITVGGKVSDEKGIGLPGVSVQIKGTSVGTVTDANGNYSISVPDNLVSGSLSFSYIGYAGQEIAIGSRKTINVKLLPSSGNELNDVVVVGYGTQKRVSITGSVSTIDAKNIENKPVLNAYQALQGEAPNLIIQQTNLNPGSDVTVNIRGVGTLGDNTPLVVVDGIVGGNLNTINPNDIASVSVLKDAGSAAIYGSRAANGVILITTKAGKLNQKTTVSYNGSYGIQDANVLVHKVPAWQNAYYKNESLVNSGLSPAYSPDQIQQLKDQGDGTWDIEHLLRTAPQQSHNVNIAGGGEKVLSTFRQVSRISKVILLATGVRDQNLDIRNTI
ncbi:TonB-dependent receptor plug domain-containing protein [Pedobacter sp. P26]|uniref:TonB-dependent receptor plug domain-containing protein n=1 Tax=Pedobacter sp. P26 TaxID=3423956 RepID=UPI003D66DC2B